MRTLPNFFLILAALTALITPSLAEELLPPDRPLPEVVDHYIQAKLTAEGITANRLADDAAFLRRVTLDLVGRIPTVEELQTYTSSTDPARKVKLVEQLLASSAYARHQATEFDAMMMTDVKGSIREYLTRAFSENRPWDQIFREVLLPDETAPERKGTTEFLRSRINDLDLLTNDVSVTFFGVNVSCARCHDHPLVDDWKQDHFFGMKSFFNRTFDAGGFIGERDYGSMKFKPLKGAEKPAKAMFLTGKEIVVPASKELTPAEQKKEKELLEELKKNKTPPPPPSYSLRAQLVDLSLQPGERDFFARSIVNRVWLRLFGHGLVMPVDQMHSENPPTHPELLAWLARDLIDHKYDLKHLFRGLVLSETYARSSQWDSEDVPRANLFAGARVRPLSRMQLALSLRVATTDPTTLKSEGLDKRLESIEATARGLASQFEQPGEDFQISVGEAMLFNNDERIQRDLLADGGDRLVGRLNQIKDRRELIDTAVRAVLSRPARPDEIEAISQYLAKREDRSVEAVRQVVWALLTSAEFRFNH